MLMLFVLMKNKTSKKISDSNSYLEGQGGLVSRLRNPITHIVTLIIPSINPLTKSP